jgi:hypothetical protein
VSQLINTVAGSISTALKFAFPVTSLLEAVWTEYFLQEHNVLPVRSPAQYKQRQVSYRKTTNTGSTGNIILTSEGASAFNVHTHCDTKQFCK